jgi:exodeoxyribonuclease VII small subunit
MGTEKSGDGPAAGAGLGFEEALRQLEVLVESLDSGGLDLEQSLRVYEQGMRLVRVCSDRLSAAELRVRQLDADPRGELVELPLDEGKEA